MSRLEWAEAREPTVPTIVPDAIGILEAETPGQHEFASLCMTTEVTTEAHAIVENSLGETG